MRLALTSQVIIASQIEKTIKLLIDSRTDERIVIIATLQMEGMINCSEALRPDECMVIITEKKTFLVEDAKLAIEKAYMSSEVETVIILVANEFSSTIQNKLLKVIEEPPARVSFILITLSKATVLPTIRSRLPISVVRETREAEVFELDMKQLDLTSVYAFIQNHKRLMDKAVAKSLVEKISTEAMKSQQFDLDEKTLQLFQNAFKALDVGSPPQFVLMTLLLKLLAKKKR
ncbi:MAG: DNA polymerase III subunit delta' [Campylobacterota bacterium]|nr:DNA polymerase III subunit delta' [Campylobacterota bacterium]